MIQDIATVFWRDWIVLRHRLLKFILSRMVAPVLYMVAFGWGLARSVNTGRRFIPRFYRAGHFGVKFHEHCL